MSTTKKPTRQELEAKVARLEDTAVRITATSTRRYSEKLEAENDARHAKAALADAKIAQIKAGFIPLEDLRALVDGKTTYKDGGKSLTIALEPSNDDRVAKAIFAALERADEFRFLVSGDRAYKLGGLTTYAPVV
jgi:hypothetical protein